MQVLVDPNRQLTPRYEAKGLTILLGLVHIFTSFIARSGKIEIRTCTAFALLSTMLKLLTLGFAAYIDRHSSSAAARSISIRCPNQARTRPFPFHSQFGSLEPTNCCSCPTTSSNCHKCVARSQGRGQSSGMAR